MKRIILGIVVLFLGGCGNDTHPPQNQDEIYDPIPVYHREEAIAPDSYDKFQDLLEGSKLQYPDGGTVVNAGEFAGYKSNFFYCDTRSYLHFTIDKTASMLKIRSELREINEWQTSDIPAHVWQARVKTPKPKKGVDTYTWMQIHGTNDTYDFPLLRLAWVRDHEGKHDHLWAIVIINTPRKAEENREISNTYSWVDLGKRNSDFFTLTVHIGENKMVISLNDKVIVDKDVTYWQEVLNYFKGGVYMNRHDDVGMATVLFDQMMIK